MTNTTLTLTTAGGTTSTLVSALDEEGKIDKNKLTPPIVTTSIATGSTMAAQYSNHKGMERIYEEYSSAYIDIMSEEELVSACEQAGILESELAVKNDTKSL